MLPLLTLFFTPNKSNRLVEINNVVRFFFNEACFNKLLYSTTLLNNTNTFPRLLSAQLNIFTASFESNTQLRCKIVAHLASQKIRLLTFSENTKKVPLAYTNHYLIVDT